MVALAYSIERIIIITIVSVCIILSSLQLYVERSVGTIIYVFHRVLLLMQLLQLVLWIDAFSIWGVLPSWLSLFLFNYVSSTVILMLYTYMYSETRSFNEIVHIQQRWLRPFWGGLYVTEFIIAANLLGVLEVIYTKRWVNAVDNLFDIGLFLTLLFSLNVSTYLLLGKIRVIQGDLTVSSPVAVEKLSDSKARKVSRASLTRHTNSERLFKTMRNIKRFRLFISIVGCLVIAMLVRNLSESLPVASEEIETASADNFDVGDHIFRWIQCITMVFLVWFSWQPLRPVHSKTSKTSVVIPSSGTSSRHSS